MIFSSPTSESRDNGTSRRGFTLMELIISVAVFSVIVLVAVSIMLSAFQAQAKATAIKDVIDNARFTLELMTRELRTGANIRLTALPPSGCPRNGLEFTSYNQGSAQERFYYWEDTNGDLIPDALMRVAMPTGGSVDCTAVAPQQFTSQEIIVDRWRVGLLGTAVGPTDGQPRVTIELAVHSRNPRYGPETIMNVQTTVTARLRDL